MSSGDRIVPMINRDRLIDAALLPITDKVEAGERLSDADGVTLFRTPDLLGVGLLADAINRCKHGDRVTFAANQHINPTNICVLRKTCVFCSFARLPKESGAYHYTLDQVLEEARAADNGLTREFHIVGGLDMQAGLAYYVEMFEALKARYPHVHIKALTAVELAHIARIDKIPVADVLRALRDAGILPKGGILRLYGRAKIHKSGSVYEEVWSRLIEAEKKGDPEKKGHAVLVAIERAEDLSGQPLT